MLKVLFSIEQMLKPRVSSSKPSLIVVKSTTIDDGFALSEVHARIPEDTDILLTHTPPYKILDQTRKGINAGCKQLAQRMTELHACRLHVFGHIHEATGAQVISDGAINRVAVNAAMGSLGSDAKAIIVDLKN